MNMRRIYNIALGVLAGITISFGSWAQPAPYPSRPLRIVVAFEAGTYTDIVARMLADRLSVRLGQPVTVENRPGAGGNIGTEYVALSPADGYIILFVSIATHGINPSLFKNLKYDAQKDFTPLSLTMKVPNVAVVHPSVQARTLKELVDYAKVNPGKLDYASAGPGTSQHMTGELLKSLTETHILHIPYKGSQAAVTDLLSGRVQVSFLNLPFVLPYVKDQRLRALVITSDKRSTVMPDVPSAGQAGFPGFTATSWSGMVVRSGTPQPIVDRLGRELRDITRSPDMMKFFEGGGAEGVGSSPEEFKNFINEEIVKWRGVVERSGAKVE